MGAEFPWPRSRAECWRAQGPWPSRFPAPWPPCSPDPWPWRRNRTGQRNPWLCFVDPGGRVGAELTAPALAHPCLHCFCPGIEMGASFLAAEGRRAQDKHRAGFHGARRGMVAGPKPQPGWGTEARGAGWAPCQAAPSHWTSSVGYRQTEEETEAVGRYRERPQPRAEPAG